MKKIILAIKQIVVINKLLYRSLKLRCQYYSRKSKEASNTDKIVVLMIDGRCLQGGLADRLKGITTVYYLSKQLGYDFRINHTSPFELEKIYTPNMYDWRITPSELSYNTKDTYVCNLMGLCNDVISPEATKKILLNILKKNVKQIHIYTNASYALYQTDSYATLYNELFKIESSFEIELEQHFKKLGDDYICVATRFCSALGDFKDANFVVLTEEQRKDLITRCLHQIEQIHLQYPDKRIHVTSDSRRFMDQAILLGYVYCIEGKKVNIDRTDERDFKILKNSIIDFMLISKASRVIQIKSQEMYSGAFAQSAAFLNNAPFEFIEF